MSSGWMTPKRRCRKAVARCVERHRREAAHRIARHGIRPRHWWCGPSAVLRCLVGCHLAASRCLRGAAGPFACLTGTVPRRVVVRVGAKDARASFLVLLLGVGPRSGSVLLLLVDMAVASCLRRRHHHVGAIGAGMRDGRDVAARLVATLTRGIRAGAGVPWRSIGTPRDGRDSDRLRDWRDEGRVSKGLPSVAVGLRVGARVKIRRRRAARNGVASKEVCAAGVQVWRCRAAALAERRKRSISGSRCAGAARRPRSGAHGGGAQVRLTAHRWNDSWAYRVVHAAHTKLSLICCCSRDVRTYDDVRRFTPEPCRHGRIAECESWLRRSPLDPRVECARSHQEEASFVLSCALLSASGRKKEMTMKNVAHENWRG